MAAHSKRSRVEVRSPGRRALAKSPTSTPAAPGATLPAELVDMDQAIAFLQTTRPTFYRWLRSGRIKGMKVGRQWRFYRADLDRFLSGQEPRVEITGDIQSLLEALRSALRDVNVRDPDLGCPSDAPDMDAAWTTQTQPVSLAARMMIRLGVALRASDLHIEPVQIDYQRHLRLRYRIDGMLHTRATADIRLLPALVEHWKRMAACDPNEKSLNQDGRIIVDSDTLKLRLDMRICFLPSALGESITVRFLPHLGQLMFDLRRLPFAPADMQRIERCLQAPAGMMYCTGPAGSGKTTTLYACLSRVATEQTKTLTIEDPVEYLLPNMIQTGVDPKAGMTFARAVRAALRSDPDVLMIGEIRDQEMLNLAFQCALTGHLVLSTLHTNTAVGALLRMLNLGAEAFLISDAVRLIVAQRLLRQLCPHCAQPTTPGGELLKQAEERGRAGGIPLASLTPAYRAPVGCAKCGQTGYLGRTLISETLEMSPEIARALRRGADEKELTTIAVGLGMSTMAADGIRRAALGQTSLEEALHNAPLA